MNDIERLQLNKMVKMNNIDDQTDLIRKLKHSHLLKKDIYQLLLLKDKYKEDLDTLNIEITKQCSFLFNNYTDIFNRIKKDEIDIKLLFHFIEILSQIENGELDQHDGSYLIGKLLKEIYVDSALKKSEKINKDEIIPEFIKPININWKEWKKNI